MPSIFSFGLLFTPKAVRLLGQAKVFYVCFCIHILCIFSSMDASLLSMSVGQVQWLHCVCALVGIP